MSRVREIKAKIAGLERKLKQCKEYKTKIKRHHKTLGKKLRKKHIDYTSYRKHLERRIKGRTTREWHNFYENHERILEHEIKKHRAEIRAHLKFKFLPKITSVFFLLIILSLTFIFFLKPAFVGLVVQEQIQEFTQQIELNVDSTSLYEWQLGNPGTLDSVKLSGEIVGKGTVKVYLDDILILDSKNLDTKQGGITGQVISSGENLENTKDNNLLTNLFKKIFKGLSSLTGLATEEAEEAPSDSADTSDSSDSNVNNGEAESQSDDSSSQISEIQESNSEEINEVGGSETREDTNPTQENSEPPASSETQTENNKPEEIIESESIKEENETVIEETQENEEITGERQKGGEEKQDEEKKKQENLKFTDICEETCELKDLELNKSSYTLKIELSNSRLQINEIKYSIITEKTEVIEETASEDVEKNITETKETPKNTTVANIPTTIPIHIKTVPNIQIQKNSYSEINLEEYFSNANEFYILQIDGITTTISNQRMIIQPDSEFTGIRKTNIIAKNEIGQIESNSFNIIVTESVEEIPKIPEVPEPEINTTKPKQDITPIIPEINETEPEINITEANITKTDQTNITPETNVTIPENITEINITEENISVTTTQLGAILGQPVKWKKEISIETPKDIVVKLPKEAENIVVKKIEDRVEEKITSSKLSITGQVTSEEDKTISQEGFLIKLFKKLFGAITGRVTEEETNSEDLQKSSEELEVQITTDNSTVHYENVLIFTDLSESLKVTNPSRVKIYWRENDSYLPMQTIEDKNANGIYDYIEFIAPQLSNQTFDIIVITKAEHLNENKEFVSDIYEQVKTLDGVWSETIPDTHYIKVTFEKNLTSENDVTLYPRIVSGNPRIEVYEVNGTEIIAEFDSLNSNEYNKVFLTNLPENHSQDTFDLRIIDGSIEIDHIIDPDVEEWFEDCEDISEWTLEPSNGWAAGGGTCTSTNSADGNMTRSADLSGRTGASLKFDWTNSKLDSGEWFRVYAGTSSSTLAVVFQNQGNGGTQTGSETIDVASYISSTTTVRFQCFGSDGGESCTIDNLNLTGVIPADNEYPIFTSIAEHTTNNSAYVSGANYQFNSTITNTNLTAGVQINSTNYTVAGTNGGVFNTSFIFLSPGTYTYYWWSYGNGTSKNYNKTSISSYVIKKAGGNVTVYINNSLSNGTISAGTSILLNASLISGDQGINIYLYNNGTLINNGTSPISNTTTFSTAGVYNITAYYTGSQNYTQNWSIPFYVNVTPALNTAPQIKNVTVIGGTTITLNEGSNTNVTINFTVEDAQGVSDLNTAVNVTFTKAGEQTRANYTCFRETPAVGNNANYTCAVDLWWFDDDGAWIINATVSDLSNEVTSNFTQTLTVNPITGVIVGPGNLSFGTLNPGSKNQTASTALILNNTGNQDIYDGKIEINATTLSGESNSALGIHSGNFTVSNTTSGGNVQCDTSNTTAIRLASVSGKSFVSINITDVANSQMTSNLSRGNYSVNNGITGQEQLYICISLVGAELSQQSYPTSVNKAWTIRITELLPLLKNIAGYIDLTANIIIKLTQISGLTIIQFAAVISVRKRKKQKSKNNIKDDKLVEALTLIAEELKEKYPLNKKETIRIIFEKLSEKYNVSKNEIKELINEREILIPVTIFNKRLGGLEAVTRYLKENLNMSYHEIAELLKRDDRTIWTSYNKAKEKQKEHLKIKETQIHLPVSIFKDRNLTVLESAILHLRNRKMKYSEIAKLLERDVRNIQTIYSRGIKKLK